MAMLNAWLLALRVRVAMLVGGLGGAFVLLGRAVPALLRGEGSRKERLAAFLINLSRRFTARGYSASDFNLRMTREEIGSYLGLKLETVSRLFSKFHEDGLVQVQGRRIKIIDMPRLRLLVNRRS